MIVRRATKSDRIAVVELLRQSHAAAGFDYPFDVVRAVALFDAHMSNGVVIVIGEIPCGVLMAQCFDHPFGAGKWAKETVWFVNENNRGASSIKMLAEYEKWAREMGCVKIGMASLETNDVSAIYNRLGYSVAETHFVKDIR